MALTDVSEERRRRRRAGDPRLSDAGSGILDGIVTGTWWASPGRSMPSSWPIRCRAANGQDWMTAAMSTSGSSLP